MILLFISHLSNSNQKTTSMKQSFLSVTLLISLSFCKAQTDNRDIAEIAKTVSYYMDGGTFADSVQFSKAFSPLGQMLYMRNDTLRILSLKEFMAGARNTGQKTERLTKIDN